MPVFKSDEIIIPAFMGQGILREDTYNYSAVGCVEVGVPGKWDCRCTGMSYLKVPKTRIALYGRGEYGETDDSPGHYSGYLYGYVVEQEIPNILCAAESETDAADAGQQGKLLQAQHADQNLFCT